MDLYRFWQSLHRNQMANFSTCVGFKSYLLHRSHVQSPFKQKCSANSKTFQFGIIRVLCTQVHSSNDDNASATFPDKLLDSMVDSTFEQAVRFCQRRGLVKKQVRGSDASLNAQTLVNCMSLKNLRVSVLVSRFCFKTLSFTFLGIWYTEGYRNHARKEKIIIYRNLT